MTSWYLRRYVFQEGVDSFLFIPVSLSCQAGAHVKQIETHIYCIYLEIARALNNVYLDEQINSHVGEY